MKSIRTKLIILVLIFLIAGMGGLSFISYNKTEKIVTADLEKSIASVAQSSSTELGAWIDTRKSEMDLLANTNILKSGNKDEIIDYLNSEVQRSHVFEEFFIADTEGKAYTTAGQSVDISSSDYFKKTMESKQVEISDPFVSETDGKSVLVLSAPIKKDGAISGIIGGTVRVNDISTMLSLVKVGQTGYAYLIRGDGLYIAHQNSDLAMKYNPLSDNKADLSLVEATRKMISEQGGITRYTSGGTAKYLAYARVPGVSWTLAVTAPVDELAGEITSLPVLYLTNTLVVSLVIAVVLIIFLRRMFANLRLVTARAVRIAEGDLTGNAIDVKTSDEMGLLAGSFNSLLNGLKEITIQLQQKAKNVSSSANILMASAENVSAGAAETAVTISQVAGAVEKVTQNSRQIAQSSEKASVHARESRDGIRQIIGQMDIIQKATASSSQVINGLNQSAGKITQIVEMITQIAEQTNLLALNAAIEAARAGEQGRGFAVVAEEVRALSEQSANAANDIHALISAIQNESNRAVQSMSEGSTQVEGGSKVVKEVGGSLEHIIVAVQDLADEIQSIATAIDDISSSVENVAAAAQEQTATMEEVSSTTEHLAAMAGELEELSNRFKI